MNQMSRQELQCFLEFVPHYFRYVNQALDEQVRYHVTGCPFTQIAVYRSFFGEVCCIFVSFRKYRDILGKLRETSENVKLLLILQVTHVNCFHCSLNSALLTEILDINISSYKDSRTSALMKQDVLIIENLFYGPKINKVTSCVSCRQMRGVYYFFFILLCA